MWCICAYDYVVGEVKMTEIIVRLSSLTNINSKHLTVYVVKRWDSSNSNTLLVLTFHAFVEDGR